MTKYIYHYFNVRGRGELPRLIFAASGVEYNDNRVPNEAWEVNDCDNDIVHGMYFEKDVRGDIKLILL